MIRFVATAEEARAAHAGTLTEVRRPVEKMPLVGEDGGALLEVVPSLLIHRGGLFDVRFNLDNPRAIRCPLGAPGDLLFVGEAWRSWIAEGEDEDEDGGSTCWRQTYVAYEATPRRGYRPEPDREFITFLDDSSPLLWNPRLLGPWEPAGKLPVGFARTTLRNLGVRVERVGDVWTWIVSVETVMRDGKPVRPAEVEKT